MAEVLKEFEFRQGGNGDCKHPWSDWLDGRIHRLNKEDMGNASLRTMAAMFHRHAKKRGKKVHLSIDKKAFTMVVQAYEPAENSSNGEAHASVADEKIGEATSSKRARKGKQVQV
jgi:hypothetical protein